MKLAVQTYNLSKTSLNFEEKIKVIATLGYRYVELAGYENSCIDGCPPRKISQILEENKITAFGSHVRYNLLETDMDNVISLHKAIGVCGVAIPRPVVKTKADMNELIHNIIKFSKQLSQAGLYLYYHCHDFEFQEIEGIKTIDEILSKTDVMLEIDVFWAIKGGIDVIKFLQAYKERILFVHLKDSDENGPCAVGCGRLPCKDIYKSVKELGFEYIVVEDDSQLPDGITSICNSIQAIRKFE